MFVLVLLLAGFVLGAAGCGGAEGRSAPRAHVEKPRAGGPQERRGVRGRAALRRKTQRRTGGEAVRRHGERIGAAGRRRAVGVVAASFLRAQSLVDASFVVSRDGYAIEVFLPPADACAAPGRIVARAEFARTLRDAAAFLRTVTVRVTGEPGTLRSYRAAHCGRQRPVYARQGSGPYVTPAFTIRRGPWIVLLATRGGPGQVDAVPAAGPDRAVGTLTLTATGVTSRLLSRPGRYRLRVRGRGAWTVTVLEAGAAPTSGQPRQRRTGNT